MKKLLVVGVIVLFLGLAIAPSINANVSKTSIDSELVEITTEVCGLNGDKQTVQLTKEEAEEVDLLFKSIREQLNVTESKEEAVEIFNEAVEKLDEYGLLGGLSVKQAQKLVTNHYLKHNLDGFFRKKHIDESLNDSLNNFGCLIAGRTYVSHIWFEGPFSRLCFYVLFTIFSSIVLTTLFFIYFNFAFALTESIYNLMDKLPGRNPILDTLCLIFELPFLSLLFCVFYVLLSTYAISLSAVQLGSTIGIGGTHYHESYNYTSPAKIWLMTLGLNGQKNCGGDFYGNFPFPPVIFSPLVFYVAYYPGILGFIGLSISIESEEYAYHYLLGSALGVKIGSEPPYDPYDRWWPSWWPNQPVD